MGDRRGRGDAHALVSVGLASPCEASSTDDPTGAVISGVDDFFLCSTKPVHSAPDQLGDQDLAIRVVVWTVGKLEVVMMVGVVVGVVALF